MAVENKKNIVYKNQKMADVVAKAAEYATTDEPVLITGETGTGKELIANEIHVGSQRSDRLLKTVNCAKFDDSNSLNSELFGHEKGAYTGAHSKRNGIIKEANGKTLFLDEIHRLSVEAQGKLLRVIEYGDYSPLGSDKTYYVNIRIIAAGKDDLKQRVDNGQFLPDLYYRLKVFSLTIPPLRERRDDIDLLLQYFFDEQTDSSTKIENRIPTKLLKLLHEYSWPGNVRELRNEVKQLSLQIKNGKKKGEIQLGDDITSHFNDFEDSTEFLNDAELVELSLRTLMTKYIQKPQKTFRDIYDRWEKLILALPDGDSRILREFESIDSKSGAFSLKELRIFLKISNNHFPNLKKEINARINKKDLNPKLDFPISNDENVLFQAFSIFPPKEIEEMYRQDEEFYFDWDDPADRAGVIRRIEKLLSDDKIEIEGPLRGDFNKWKYQLGRLAHAMKHDDVVKNSKAFKNLDQEVQDATTKLIQQVGETYPGTFNKFLFSV